MAPRKDRDWPISSVALTTYLKYEIKRLRRMNKLFALPGEGVIYSTAIKTLNSVLTSIGQRTWTTEEGVIRFLRYSDGVSPAPMPQPEMVRVRRARKGYAIVYKSSVLCEHANECPQSCRCPFDCACRAGMCPPIEPPSGAPVVLMEEEERPKRRKRK
jgi:hypothetical protein